MARPVNPLARPASARQATSRPRGEVSIPAHTGPYLEVLVLHQLPPNAFPQTQEHHRDFIQALDRGGSAGFQRLSW